MSRTCSCSLSFAALLASVAAVHGADAKTPRTDLYGDPLPPGAVMRLGTIRLRHTNADVVFSKDGKQLISCGHDAEVRVWDVDSGKLLRRSRWDCGSRDYSRVVLSPDGSRVAAVRGSRLYLHDAHTGVERGQLNLAEGSPVKFSADAALLVVEAPAENGWRALEIWDVAAVKRRQRLEVVSSDCAVIDIAFSKDAKHLAGFTSMRDQIYFWDGITGKLLNKKADDGEAAVEALAFSPDGKTLAVAWGASWDAKARVQLLDAADYSQKAVLPMPADVRAKIFGTLAFSADGRLLAASYGNNLGKESGVVLWDATGAKPARRLPERRSAALTFAPDGKTLACRDNSGSALRLWDTASGRQRLAFAGFDRPVETMTASPNGKFLAAAADDDEVHLWDTAAGQRLRALKRGPGPHPSCVFSPDSERLISSERGSALALQEWEIATGKKGHRFTFPAPFAVVYGLGISDDGKRLSAVASDRQGAAQVIIWDALTAKKLGQRPYKLEGRLEKPPPLFAPDGERLLRIGNEYSSGEEVLEPSLRLSVEEVATGNLWAELPKGVELPVVFSSDGRLLAAPGFSAVSRSLHDQAIEGLSIIEAASGEEIVRLKTGEVDYLAFFPEGHSVAVANKKGVRVWDADTGMLLRTMAWPKDIVNRRGEARIHSLAVLPGGRLATAMHEGDVLLWDPAAATWPTPKGNFTRKPLEALWSDLEGDAREAPRAIRALAGTPAQTVLLLSRCLRPMAADRAHVDKLLADLESKVLAEREAASRSLARIRDGVTPRLRQVLREKPSLELRLRIEALLAEPKHPPIETVRTLRAIDVLERIDTPEARRLLEKLAGSAAPPEARAAQQALHRLKYR